MDTSLDISFDNSLGTFLGTSLDTSLNTSLGTSLDTFLSTSLDTSLNSSLNTSRLSLWILLDYLYEYLSITSMNTSRLPLWLPLWMPLWISLWINLWPRSSTWITCSKIGNSQTSLLWVTTPNPPTGRTIVKRRTYRWPKTWCCCCSVPKAEFFRAASLSSNRQQEIMRRVLACGSPDVTAKVYRICHGSFTCSFFCLSLWILDVERKGLAILQREVTVNVPVAQLTSLTLRTVTKANKVPKVGLQELYRRLMGTVHCVFGKILK